MKESLPRSGFEWIKPPYNQWFYTTVPDDAEIGYILEVDLDYPINLHDTHKDLPFCPEHRVPPGSKDKKLLTSLYKKNRYVIHYRSLKHALNHGLILTRIHRVLQFHQSRWMEPYIDLNSNKRKHSKNNFEKNLYKLLNNAVFGKTMENQRNHVEVKLVTHWDGRYGAEALIARPNFKSCANFGDDVVAVELAVTDIYLNKPIYVGMSVLDISKIKLYEFHYGLMRQQLQDRCKLLYTDTDSLIYEIQGVNAYEFMKSHPEEFDTSDYPDPNAYDITPSKHTSMKVGLMKDECKGKVMIKFAGLRSKVYCLQMHGQKEEVKKAKGVKTSVIQSTIKYEDYVDCLFNNIEKGRKQKNIRSRLHVVRTEEQTKIALSPDDDKRHLLHEQTDTLPWGHYSINEGEVRLERQNQQRLRKMMRRIGWGEEEEELLQLLLVPRLEGEESGMAAQKMTEGRALYKRTKEQPEHSPSSQQPPSKKPRVNSHLARRQEWTATKQEVKRLRLVDFLKELSWL